MRNLGSPFLHRDVSHAPRHRIDWRRDTQAQNLQVERAKARNTLEKLRYKSYVRADSLSRFMQRLGDWGRKYVPAIRAIRFRY